MKLKLLGNKLIEVTLRLINIEREMWEFYEDNESFKVIFKTLADTPALKPFLVVKHREYESFLGHISVIERLADIIQQDDIKALLEKDINETFHIDNCAIAEVCDEFEDIVFDDEGIREISFYVVTKDPVVEGYMVTGNKRTLDRTRKLHDGHLIIDKVLPNFSFAGEYLLSTSNMRIEGNLMYLELQLSTDTPSHILANFTNIKKSRFDFSITNDGIIGKGYLNHITRR
jgi:hypothetical protein